MSYVYTIYESYQNLEACALNNMWFGIRCAA